MKYKYVRIDWYGHNDPYDGFQAMDNGDLTRALEGMNEYNLLAYMGANSWELVSVVNSSDPQMWWLTTYYFMQKVGDLR